MLKKFCVAVACIIGGLIVLIGAFYAEENWRGRYAWERYQSEREAKGDSFQWSAIVPPHVPAKENIATTPLFAELFPKPPRHPRLDAVRLPDCTNAMGDWFTGRAENLATWRMCFTNDDLLAALKKYEPILREINEAARRPHARFPLRYEDSFATLLPHLRPLRDLARVYRLHALAELALGRTDAALEDIETNLRLAGTLKDEPMLISFLVRTAIIHIAIQPVWEGLTAHRWNESQLSVLQAQFEKIDQFESFAKVMRGERLTAYDAIRGSRDHPGGFLDLLFNYSDSDFPSQPKGHLVDRAVPSGWFFQNQLRADRFYNETYLPAVDWEHRRISPQAIKRADHSLKTMRTTPYTVLWKLLATVEIPAARRVALSQTAVYEAVVACALERYRLAHGQLPDTLDALVPEFLTSAPHDVIDGLPLRYHRTAADQFVLYSIGWNERDDGGQIAWKKGEPRQQDYDSGDWVWFSQPTTITPH